MSIRATDESVTAPRPADWAEPGIGPNWRYRFFARVMRLGGKARGYHLANFGAVWYTLFYPSIRRRCAPYLSRRFRGRRGVVKRLLDTFWMIQAYGATLVDMLVLAMYGREAFTSRSRDHERFLEIASDPRGFVLVLGHVGCWQIGTSALGELNRKVSVIMIPEEAIGPANRAYSIIDPRVGLSASMQMTDALLSGQVLAMMGDRALGNELTTVPVQFMGDTAFFPISPYRMASATGVPVVFMTAPRVGKRMYAVRVEAVFEVPKGLGRNAQKYVCYAQEFARCMERFVEEFPYQFYNFYDVWQEPKAPHPGSASPPSA